MAVDLKSQPFVKDHVSRATKQPKAPYKSLQAAQTEAQRMADHKGYGFSAYLCRHCNFYHVGTDKTSKKSRNRQTLKFELGDRAYMGLVKESCGRRRNRVKYIRDKARLVLIIRRKRGHS